MTSAPIDPLIGQTFDERYIIRSRIARGGMAVVYLANDLRLERKVAVKVMHEHLAEDENFTRRFEREARSAARLSHTNLVNVFDQGHDFGRTYLVMEYLPHITLRQLLKQQQRLTLDEALEITEAVLGGLAAAHSAGIVHRDLKPENVLLVDDGRIKIGDFGLARAVSANTTTGQALLGTIAYLSPELVTRGIADERSDLYSFGIMLYEMLTGVQPYVGEQPMQIAYQHAHSDVPAPSEHSDVSTPALDEFIIWLTQRDPELRPANAGEAFEHFEVIRRDPYASQTSPLVHPDSPGETSDETAVLPTSMFSAALANEATHDSAATAATTHLTPSTAVLDPLQQAALGAASATAAASGIISGGVAATSAMTVGATHSAVDHARAGGAKRSRRGKVVAAVLAGLIVLTGATGFWLSNAKVNVPDVAGMEMASAQAELERLSLVVDTSECSSLTVEAGLAAETDPKMGTSLDRGSSVTLCKSTGPRMLAVPTLIGLTLDEAVTLIKQSEFSFGEVVDRRFSDAAEDIVLGALDENDAELSDTFPENGTINLVVSAGSVPGVTGLSVDEATGTLEGKGLVIDAGLNGEAHSEDIAEGKVIGVVLSTDPVRPGDAVGLTISLGPELFPVPEIAGLGLRDAMDTITAAGFTPTTLVPEALRGLAVATGTNPAAGERLKAGAEVRVTSQLSL